MVVVERSSGLDSHCTVMTSMGIICIESIFRWKTILLRRHVAPFRPDPSEARDRTKDSRPHLHESGQLSVQ